MQNKHHPDDLAPQPVAYDAEGRPLYHHPPVAPAPVTSVQPEVPHQPSSFVRSKPESYEGSDFDPRLRAQYANEPKVVHAPRAYEPKVRQISEKLQRKHEESKRLYPFLNLSKGEFVMLRIQRHPIGLFIPVGITAVVLVCLAAGIFFYPEFHSQSSAAGYLPDVGAVVGILLVMMGLAVAVGGIAVWVYLQNQFFLTNESVIQEIQHGLFSRHEQTVSLGSIEDASFKQYGVVPHIFGYGLMRLSTEGQETTYRFNFVENPKEQVAIVNNAVEAFKNGRPVGLEYLND